eukprot:scaffold80340_cov32-Tisochrysis_lutea.AAC.3
MASRFEVQCDLGLRLGSHNTYDRSIFAIDYLSMTLDDHIKVYVSRPRGTLVNKPTTPFPMRLVLEPLIGCGESEPTRAI